MAEETINSHLENIELATQGTDTVEWIVYNACPNIDVWGINVYRGGNFNDNFDRNLFSQWAGISSKPFYLSEFGTDSFCTYVTSEGNSDCNLSQGIKRFECNGEINEDLQLTHTVGLWNEINKEIRM